MTKSDKKILELRKELNDLCKKTKTSESRITYLVHHYISLGRTEEQALKYVNHLLIKEVKL